jgi:hypothetical protein
MMRQQCGALAPFRAHGDCAIVGHDRQPIHSPGYVADGGNNRVRKVAPDGSTTTLTGNGVAGHMDGTGGAHGTAELAGASGVAVDDIGNVYVTEPNAIRKVTPDGTTSTIAGSGTSGFRDGDGCSALFAAPQGIAGAGKMVIIGEGQSQRVRKIQLP